MRVECEIDRKVESMPANENENLTKSQVRRQLRQALAAMTDEDRHQKSTQACSFISRTPEFQAANVVMLYLSSREEVDTAHLAWRCWRDGKTVVVPKVSWEQRRMLPTEITSLQDNIATTTHGVREPVGGKPVPIDMIDLVIVPGLGFCPAGFRIGRGMGFYDRFLAQSEFSGLSCGLCFDEQILPQIPVLDHDVPLSMLVSDRGIRRFASQHIRS